MSKYYIASCVFTWHYPQLSQRAQAYAEKQGLTVVRCCVPKYKLEHFTGHMPAAYQDTWAALPDSGDFVAGDTVYTLCHNCSAIIEETKPGVTVKSLWELMDEDPDFSYPDFTGHTMILQDCWRAFDRTAEQDAVRSLLKKMKITVVEQEERREKTDFCGVSTLRPAPPRNLKLAPQRFVHNANVQGKFEDCTPEEQKRRMTEYCQRFNGKEVVSYCPYCMEGLLLGGARAKHLAELAFNQFETYRK